MSGWKWLVLAVAAGGGYYWYTHRAVTQFTPGSKYHVTGGAAAMLSVLALGWSSDTSTTLSNGGNTATILGTYNGSPSAVPAGMTANAA